MPRPRVAFHSDKTIGINGNGTVYEELFEITGSVTIEHFYGEVITDQLASTLTAVYLDLNPAVGDPVVLTKISGAPAISDYEIGSILAKNSDKGDIIDVQRANVCMLLEAGVALEDIPFPFVVGKMFGQVTRIRFSYVAGADYVAEIGEILWHCEWKPRSDDGLLLAV